MSLSFFSIVIMVGALLLAAAFVGDLLAHVLTMPL